MKPVIPHEHGGWVFLAVPLIVGTWLGNPSVYHLLLFFSWLFFYMGTYAMREWLKRKGKEKRYFYWMLIYGSLAAVTLILPLWRELSLSIVLLLILPSIVINLFSIYQKNERGMLNNIAAFHAFALGAVAAYVLGTGTWDLMVLWLYLHCLLFFIAIVFFVKSIIRERKNPKWLRYAKVYHWVMLVAPILFGFPLLVIPYLFSILSLYLWGGKSIKPIQVGIIEIVNSVQFALLTIVLI